MENTASDQTGRLNSVPETVARLQYSLLPAIPALLYLAVYAAAECGIRVSGLNTIVSNFSLTTGLNLGLLLTYGIWYAPVVVLAVIVHGLWLYPLPYSVPISLLFYLGLSLLQVAGAALLLRFSPEPYVTLRRSRDVLTFIVTGALVSMALGAAAAAGMILESPMQWDRFLIDFKINLTSFAFGVFFVTP